MTTEAVSDIQAVRIDRMSYGPDSIGRLSSGKTVFVEGGVPGDLLEVEVIQEKPSFAKARLVRVLEASPERMASKQALGIESICPWAALSYKAQLAAKQENVRSALMRTAHVDADSVDVLLQPIIPCKNEWGYRNKLELAATADQAGKFELGFHVAESDAVQIAKTCALGNRLIERSPKALAGAIRFMMGEDSLGIYRVGVRGSLSTKSVQVALWTPPSAFPRSFAAKLMGDAVKATSVVRVIAEQGSARKVKRVEVLEGKPYWEENLAGSTYSVSAPSFFQVNTNQAAKLVALVQEGLEVAEGEFVADLYSGVGTFSIPMAKSGADVVAIELAGSSAKDFRRNCDANGVDIEMICDDVARVLPELGGLDAVVVDPPRAGLEGRVIDQVTDAAPSRIAYVSCDPQTLARDVARFAERGYGLRQITPVDMFPQTFHVETVSIFTR